jgi:asparagine synthase (glutamine-hydrolysing)
MCGISGIFNFEKTAINRVALESMTNILAHRGPDGQGIWINGNIGFGHRRLAIIDLSEEANQPMHSADGKFTITFNGEIYNYKELRTLLSNEGIVLRTNSDTETIIYLYQIFGQNCLTYLRGMFAFSIWDESKRELFVARDRIGIKPLYYLHKNNRFVFASELKSIVASGYSEKKLDTNAFLSYLRFLTYQQPDSVFEDIKKLEPGHYILVNENGEVVKIHYWDVNNTISSKEIIENESNYIQKLDHILSESVRYHMIADVPVAAFLSGGVDSSSIVALMRKNFSELEIKTFSIVFPGLLKYDEGMYATRVGKLFNTNHFAKHFTTEFINDFKDICWFLDEPFAVSSSFATYFLAKYVSKNAKVVLTGDGGDELFGGYEGYLNNGYLNGSTSKLAFYTLLQTSLLYLSQNFGLHNPIINRLLAGMSRRIGNEGVRFSNLVGQNAMYFMGIVLDSDYYYNSLTNWSKNIVAYYYNDIENSDPLFKKLYCTFKTRLVDEMLMKVDRMTMAHSLEARVPLLDNSIVEFAFSLPSNLKICYKDGVPIGKYILKRAMERYLPDDILYRNKQGFNIPQFLVDNKTNFKSVKEVLLYGFLIKNNIITQKGLLKLFDLVDQSQKNVYNMIVLLYTFEIWCKKYTEHFGVITIR